MALCFHSHALDCAGRAADRGAAILHRELARGTTSLQAIAYIAPLLGMFGTAVLLMSVMRRPVCDLCDYSGGSAEALVPIALSLPLTIFACGGFHCLRHRIEAFDLEMHTATLDLLNH